MNPVTFGAAYPKAPQTSVQAARFGKTAEASKLNLGGIKVELTGNVPAQAISEALEKVNSGKTYGGWARKIAGKAPKDLYLEFFESPSTNQVGLVAHNLPNGGQPMLMGGAERNADAIRELLVETIESLSFEV